MSFDLYLFNFINKFSGRWRWLDVLAIFFAKYLPYFLIPVLVCFTSGANFVFAMLSGVFARVAVTELIYFFYKRQRPVEVLDIRPLIKKPNHPSLPSGHAAFFFAISFSLLARDPILGAVFLVLSFLISLSRVFSGVHWPSDIIAGILAGGISAVIVHSTSFLWM